MSPSGALGFILVVNALIFGFASGAIRKNQGGSFGEGFVWGALLGIIGLIVVAATKPSGSAAAARGMTRECPHCKEPMRRDASVCPHCQRDSAPWVFHNGVWWARDPQGAAYYMDEKLGAWRREGESPSR